MPNTIIYFNIYSQQLKKLINYRKLCGRFRRVRENQKQTIEIFIETLSNFVGTSGKSGFPTRLIIKLAALSYQLFRPINESV